MKKITLLNVQKWVYDNLKESGGNEYYISLYDSLASYVSDASDDPDIWDYLRTVLDQYGSSITTMLQHKDPVAIVSKTGGEVDRVEYLYESIYNGELSFSQLFNEIEADYYMFGADKLDKILYALEEILKNDDHKEFYSLDFLSIESDGLYIKFGVISERYVWSDIELEVLNRLADAGLDAHDTIIFKEGLKTLAIMVVNSLEYSTYIPEGFSQKIKKV